MPGGLSLFLLGDVDQIYGYELRSLQNLQVWEYNNKIVSGGFLAGLEPWPPTVW